MIPITMIMDFLVQRNYHVRRSGIYFHLIILFGTNSMIETREEVATDISLVYRVRAVVFDREVRNNGKLNSATVKYISNFLQMQEKCEG